MARPVTPKIAALIDRGVQLARSAQFAEAARAFERALQQMPELTEVHAMHAESLQMARRLDDAERAWRVVLRRDPHSLAALEGMGFVCMAQGRLAELEQLSRAGCAAAPFAPGFVLRLGYALWWQGRHEEALAAYRRGAELAAGRDAAFFHEANLARAMACFRLGRWEEGWMHYRSRQDREALRAQYPRLAAEPESLREAAPQRIAVHGEQGLGDELFFLRFAHALRAKGHALLLRANAKLVPLLRQRTDLFAEVEPAGTPAQCDVELQSSDLALASGVAFAEPLALTAEEGRRAVLRRRLEAFGPPPYVGVTWRAGLIGEEAKASGGLYWEKHVPPARLGEALRPLQATLVILQRKPAVADTDAFSAGAGRAVLDLSAVNEDLHDALALLDVLDDYVGVSNTNMHLRAGLGRRKARVLAQAQAEWRWGLREAEALWFPGFSVYRQTMDHSWDQALDRLSSDLNS